MADTRNITVQAPNASSGFVSTIERVLNSGMPVKGDASKSIGAHKSARELVNFTLAVQDPRDRLIKNPGNKTAIVAAIARFIWMMAGNNRLADIAYYVPQVSAFSDDRLSVPGSNYGARMLQPRPGLNQIAGVVNELKNKPSSRRALIAIYQPEDATRQDSSDIPCAFGLNYLVRDGKLLATNIMRSNNAVSLLPFNLFEFSLLAEVIASEIGVELGEMTHFAMSMHVYDQDAERATKITEPFSSPENKMMQKMPSNPLKLINELAILEAEMRHAGSSLNDSTIEEWIGKAEERKLGAYWSQFFFVLLSHAAGKIGPRSYEAVRSAIREPFLSFLPDGQKLQSSNKQPAALDLFTVDHANKVENIINLDSRRMQSLKARIEEHNAHSERPLSVDAIWQLQNHFSRIAARDGSLDISSQEFSQALSRIEK